MGKRVINRGTVLWLMASASLISVIMLQIEDEAMLAPTAIAATVEPIDEKGTGEHGRLTASPDAEWLDAIVARPIFSASRRPFSPAKKQATAAPERDVEPLALDLAGTLLSGEVRVALLAHPTEGLLRLRQGEAVDGWRIEEIRENEVRLRRGPAMTLLSLHQNAFSRAR